MRGLRLDKWRLEEPLGSGGMGQVWRAAHVELGHRAAIKLMWAEVAMDEREVARFLQEGRIAAQLRHPNIVRVEDSGCAPDGRPYLVMELLAGESLGQRMARTGRLTPRVARPFMRHACSALAYAHAAGVVHRDIKPGNLLLAREHDAEVLKVLDFGLARLTAPEPNARRLTAPRVVLGTPKYMSPEQAAGQSDIDARSDLWSLGVVLYRALTGKHPFNDRGSSSELLVEVIHGVITRPSTYHSDLAGDVDAFFARALARDRTQRFQHADEMLEAYERATAALLDRPDDPADAVPILPTPRPFRVAIPVAADVTSSTSSVALDAPPEVTPRASAPASQPRPTVPAPRATASVPPARPSVRPSASLVVAPRPGGTAARASVGVDARPLARRVPMALAWILLLANAALLLYRVFLRR